MDNNSTEPAEILIDWLQQQEGTMIGLLETIVNIDSGSYDKPGVDRVIEVIQDFLTDYGVENQLIPRANHGNSLIAFVPGNTGADTLPEGDLFDGHPLGGHTLLMGHADTVFPRGTVAQRPFTIRDGIAYGPGVADMKSGLVMNTFVALAFHKFGFNRRPVYVLYTGDEEIASPASRPIIKKYAAGAATVLNAEPGRATGNVVTMRKGAMFIEFEVHGKAAHAGGNYSAGISAIDALAKKIIKLHELTDLEQGITTNVGLIEGGVSLNTIAPHAAAKLDVRYPDTVDHEELKKRIDAIIAHTGNEQGATGAVVAEGSFLPLSPTDGNKQLFDDYVQAAHSVGLEIAAESAGGSADSGLASVAGAPTLCATGPVGGNYHTDEEYCVIDTIVPRAQTAALTIFARHG